MEWLGGRHRVPQTERARPHLSCLPPAPCLRQPSSRASPSRLTPPPAPALPPPPPACVLDAQMCRGHSSPVLSLEQSECPALAETPWTLQPGTSADPVPRCPRAVAVAPNSPQTLLS